MSSNSSLSWLDPQVLKDLAEASGLTGGKPAVSRPIRGNQPAIIAERPSVPVRPTSAQRAAPPLPTVQSLKRALEEADDHAPEAEADRPALPVFRPPQAAMGARLSAFIDWLFRNLACVRVFIADGDGLPLAQRNSNIDLIGLATVLMDASRQLRGHLQLPPEGAIAMGLGPNETFQLLQIQTSWQQVSLGLIVRSTLLRETLDEVKNALRLALDEESAGMGAPTAVSLESSFDEAESDIPTDEESDEVPELNEEQA